MRFKSRNPPIVNHTTITQPVANTSQVQYFQKTSHASSEMPKKTA